MALPAEEILAIQQLIARYSFAIDSGDGDAFAGCFVADGRLVYSGGQRWEGAEALRGLAKSLARGTQMRHVVTGTLIASDVASRSEEATCRSYCLVLATGAQGAPYVLTHGTYEDRLIKRDGSWLFVERIFRADSLVSTEDVAAEGRRGGGRVAEA